MNKNVSERVKKILKSEEGKEKILLVKKLMPDINDEKLNVNLFE